MALLIPPLVTGVAGNPAVVAEPTQPSALNVLVQRRGGNFRILATSKSRPQILVRRPYLRAHEASPALVEELLDGRR